MASTFRFARDKGGDTVARTWTVNDRTFRSFLLARIIFLEIRPPLNREGVKRSRREIGQLWMRYR